MEYCFELTLYVERENLTDSDFETLSRNFEDLRDKFHSAYLAKSASYSVVPIPGDDTEKVEYIGGSDRVVAPFEVKTIPKVSMTLEDNVNSPDHYKKRYIREVIQSIKGLCTPEEYHGYLKGSKIKYLARYQDKGGIEDLEKGQWFGDELIAFEKEQKTKNQEATQ